MGMLSTSVLLNLTEHRAARPHQRGPALRQRRPVPARGRPAQAAQLLSPQQQQRGDRRRQRQWSRGHRGRQQWGRQLEQLQQRLRQRGPRLQRRLRRRAGRRHA